MIGEPWELRCHGVVKRFGGFRVLRGLDAVFTAGRIHVLEGANGSGKSTLLGVLSGRLAATRGSVTLASGTKRFEGDALRHRVGWLGHELGLYPDLTPKENLDLHASIVGVSRTSAWAVASAWFDLDRLKDRRVRDLSRGQRQRVALARALLGDRRALLLDEPSTGLDQASVARLATVLGGIADGGVLVVVVTHDTDFRDQCTGRLLWRLERGAISA